MKEKERYTIESFEIEEPSVIFDNKTQQIILTLVDYNYDEITHLKDLLNHYFKRIKELESEVKVGEFWHSAYQGKQLDYDMVYAELRKTMDENQQLIEQLEIFKTFNDALQRDNLDLSYGKWEKDYQEEIQQLKQSQKQLVIKELENLKKEFESRKLEYISHLTKKHCYGLRIDRIFEIIDNQIKELGGGENE